MSDYYNKCVGKHVSSYHERGIAIQSRRLSEYICYTPMVLRAPGKFGLASVVQEHVRQTNKVCRIAIIDAVFGRISCI